MQNLSQAKRDVKLFWQDKFNIITLATSALVNLFIWLILFFKIAPQDTPIILHYNIYFGIDVLDQWYKIYLIPTLGLILIVFNLAINLIIYKQEKLATYFLSAASLFVQVLLVFATVCIILAQ